jgi:hypothetical protein
MGKRTTNQRKTINSLLSFERRTNDSDITDDEHLAIVGLVKETFGESFAVLFGKRGRSSGDLLDYSMARGHLLGELAAESVRKQKSNLDKNPRQNNARYVSRNIRLAIEFCKRRKSNPSQSDSHLKAVIGGEQTPRLGRSAAIDAIDSGLQLLAASDPRMRADRS